MKCTCDRSKGEGCTNCPPKEPREGHHPVVDTYISSENFAEHTRQTFQKACATEAEALAKKAELERENLQCCNCPHLKRDHWNLGCKVELCRCTYFNHAPENPEPIEQAAPPRPLEILCSFCGKPMSLYWHEKLEDAIACREKVEAGLPAPAAIEQARPQPPQPNPDWWMCDECGAETADTNYHYWATKHEKYTRHQPLIPPAAAEPAPERTPPQDDTASICSQFYDRWERPGIPFYDFLQFAKKLRSVAVPEPAVQQGKHHIRESEMSELTALHDEYQEWWNTASSESPLKFTAWLERVKLRARQAEPAPTPSRAELEFIKQAQYICEMGEPRTCDIDLLRKLGKAAYPHGYKKLAEASSLGAKPENVSLRVAGAKEE